MRLWINIILRQQDFSNKTWYSPVTVKTVLSEGTTSSYLYACLLRSPSGTPSSLYRTWNFWVDPPSNPAFHAIVMLLCVAFTKRRSKGGSGLPEEIHHRRNIQHLCSNNLKVLLRLTHLFHPVGSIFHPFQPHSWLHIYICHNLLSLCCAPSGLTRMSLILSVCKQSHILLQRSQPLGHPVRNITSLRFNFSCVRRERRDIYLPGTTWRWFLGPPQLCI